MKTYGQLLSEIVPMVINNDKEYKRIEDIFAELFKKERSPDEDKLFDLLANLLEDYDRRVMPEIKRATPVETLKYLMKENNLKQSDLVGIFSSQGNVSEVLAGIRGITTDQAKQLAERFKMSVAAFI